MKKLILLLALLLPSVVVAQEATISAPVARSSEAKLRLASLTLDFVANTAQVLVAVQDSTNSEIRTVRFVVPDAARPAATFPGVLTAIGTSRGGETGGAERRGNFRLIGFLLDNGYISGVSLVP